jgi:7-dehydrocholesterol reductase
LISIALLALGTHQGWFVPGEIYDLFGNLLSSMNVFALSFCVFLTLKGYYFPSTTDNGANGSLVLDLYWGTELYPRIFGWDVKVFTNCRFGMMYWALGIISYAHKQYLDIGYVSSTMAICVALQLIYITKFYIWETGYFCSMDIQHDRAGYYLCWGCMVFLPMIYTSHTYYLVKHPIDLSMTTTAILFACGAICVFANYDADRQRQQFRA